MDTCVSTPIIPQSSPNKLATGCDSLSCLKDGRHGKGVWRRRARPYGCHLWREVSHLTPEGPRGREGLGTPWLALETYETPENPDESYKPAWRQTSLILIRFVKARDLQQGGNERRSKFLTWLIVNKHSTAVSVSSVPESSNNCLISVRLGRWGVHRCEVHYQCCFSTNRKLPRSLFCLICN